MNGTTTASLTLEGAVDSDGTCEGSTYHGNGQVWKDVVIIATIKIQVTDYPAKMKLDENEISLIGGVVCPFLKGYCFDTNLEETTWEERISNIQKILTFGNEGKAVENIIARRVAGLETTGQGFSTVNLLNTEGMKELAHNTMRQVWGWFTDLRLFMSGLMGFYAIFRIVKYGIGVILNGIQLYQTLGSTEGPFRRLFPHQETASNIRHQSFRVCSAVWKETRKKKVRIGN
ncbi:hypothetical protein JTB14_014317 [Gonioctena quinquepunctata]|nr:hypothetical protein JTB14_014317 [Gonioctena quinquepunctata]